MLGLSKDQASIDHISVHDGRLVRSCPVPQVMESAGESEWEEWEKGRRWWSMDWVGGQTGWPARKVSYNVALMLTGFSLGDP